MSTENLKAFRDVVINKKLILLNYKISDARELLVLLFASSPDDCMSSSMSAASTSGEKTQTCTFQSVSAGKKRTSIIITTKKISIVRNKQYMQFHAVNSQWTFPHKLQLPKRQYVIDLITIKSNVESFSMNSIIDVNGWTAGRRLLGWWQHMPTDASQFSMP